MTVQHMRPFKGIRTAYITDFCIGIGFIIVIAVLLNTQGETVKSALSAGEYSGNWVVFINIWAPLFTISLLSHVFLRASLGQYFHGQFLQRADGKPAGIITLAAVSVLRQVSGAVMLATDFITARLSGTDATLALLFTLFAGIFFWLVWSDFQVPNRLAGLTVSERAKPAG